ncbi:hypothetical protein M0802_006421 [Mischocyttarus mexicanus]|nr:hypothetical protein M0802_006421 [Mischocyttarus mexicanus]
MTRLTVKKFTGLFAIASERKIAKRKIHLLSIADAATPAAAAAAAANIAADVATVYLIILLLQAKTIHQWLFTQQATNAFQPECFVSSAREVKERKKDILTAAATATVTATTPAISTRILKERVDN